MNDQLFPPLENKHGLYMLVLKNNHSTGLYVFEVTGALYAAFLKKLTTTLLIILIYIVSFSATR